MKSLSDLRAEYEAGARLRDLAEYYGLSIRAVRASLVAAGAEIRAPGGAKFASGVRGERVRRIQDRIRAMATGETFTDVAAEFGISRERVRQIAERLGITGADLSQARWDAIAGEVLKLAIETDLNHAAIAERVGICRHSVGKLLDDLEISADQRHARATALNGRSQRARNNTDERSQQARELRCQGLSYDQIGERMGANASVARKLVLYGGPDPLARERPYVPRRARLVPGA